MVVATPTITPLIQSLVLFETVKTVHAVALVAINLKPGQVDPNECPGIFVEHPAYRLPDSGSKVYINDVGSCFLGFSSGWGDWELDVIGECCQQWKPSSFGGGLAQALYDDWYWVGEIAYSNSEEMFGDWSAHVVQPMNPSDAVTFISKVGEPDRHKCAGIYFRTQYSLHGRNVYIQEAGNCFLGYTSLADWSLDAMSHLDDALADDSWAGGHEFNEREEMFGEWPLYHAAAFNTEKALVFRVRRGEHGDCGGIYIRSTYKVNDEPIYFNHAAGCFLGYQPWPGLGGWTLDSIANFDEAYANPLDWHGGLAMNDSDNRLSSWPTYNVAKLDS